MSTRWRFKWGFGARLLSVLVAGMILRLILVTITPGEFYDTSAIAHVGKAFLTAPLHLYNLDVNPGSYQGSPTYPWPYLPGFLPVAGLLRWLSEHFGASVNRLDRTVIVGADVAVAWVVQCAMGRFGRSERERLQGAALVAFGPAFIAVSGVHGQIDALAWLPAVAAVALWELHRDGERARMCGALLGLGIAIKTTPGLVLLALAPTARDRRELAQLATSAALIPALMVVPFALAAPKGLAAVIDYRGFAGRAGLTVLLQPRLAVHELTGPGVSYNATTTFLLDHTGVILAVALAPVVVAVWRWRVPAATATVALLLVVYVVGPAILPQYWLWIVPFLILAGYRSAALAYQLALLPLLVANYAFLQEPEQPVRHLSTGVVLYAYVPILWILTVALCGGLVVLLRREYRRGHPASARSRHA